jgi:phosphoglycerate kinase
MKIINELNVEGKKVILRCDLNVSIKDGKIVSDERIIKSLPTIEYLIKENAKVIIMSHLGKIKVKEDCEKNSLFLVYQKLCELLKINVYFSSATSGEILENKIKSLQNGEVLLMENTRYEDLDGKKESNCNLDLAKYWASLADYFVNDAFGLSHRKHASNYGISKYLPSAIGFLMETEITGLKPLINPIKPYVVIMGGAKIEDKLDIIENILPKCNYLLVGGKIANSFLDCVSNIGASEVDKSKSDNLKKLLYIYKERIILPVDVKVLSEGIVKEKDINEIADTDNIYDIGNKTTNLYKEYIKNARTIFLNGTMGMYEDERFKDGTLNILKCVASSNEVHIIGGGDAISSAKVFNITEFSFVSTGGGATLEYIATNKLNCFED